jgi:hypothetical protein
MAEDQRNAAFSGCSSSVGFLLVPQFVWELFLGIYAAIWGFRQGRSHPLGSIRRGQEHRLPRYLT